jgi:hypothetical protein
VVDLGLLPEAVSMHQDDDESVIRWEMPCDLVFQCVAASPSLSFPAGVAHARSALAFVAGRTIISQHINKFP